VAESQFRAFSGAGTSFTVFTRARRWTSPLGWKMHRGVKQVTFLWGFVQSKSSGNCEISGSHGDEYEGDLSYGMLPPSTHKNWRTFQSCFLSSGRSMPEGGYLHLGTVMCVDCFFNYLQVEGYPPPPYCFPFPSPVLPWHVRLPVPTPHALKGQIFCDLRFSLRWLWRWFSSGLQLRVDWYEFTIQSVEWTPHRG
jgi:hypothetical protein